MVVCRYFQQGNCRFGDRCRFEHPVASGYDTNSNNAYKWYGGGSNRGVSYRDNVASKNRFDALSNQDNRQQRPKVTGGSQGFSTADMIVTISSDMDTWKSSSMWQFSCYSYFKDCSCIPGFDDISPEEMRQEAYEAQKSGDVQLYLQKVKDLVNKASQLKSELARPSMSVKQKMIQLMEEDRRRIEREPQDQSAGKTGFGTSDGLFSSSQEQTTGLFGKQTPATAIFGQTNSGLFGNNQPTGMTEGSVFGNSQSGNSVFGNSQSGNSVFGNSQSGNSVFGNTHSGNSVFGNSQSGNSVFGNNQSSAGNTGSLFGKGQPASGNSEGLFGTSQPTNSFFGSTSQTGGSIFGNSQPSTAIFGNNQQQSAVLVTGGQPNSSSSIFGGSSSSVAFGLSNPSQNTAPGLGQSVTGFIPMNQMQPTDSGSGTVASNKSLKYTPLSELTAEERRQYEAAQFSEGNLPTRPPPKELC